MAASCYGVNHCRGGKDNTGEDRCCTGQQPCMSLCYLGLSSVRVYTLIRWHVAGTSQGSCNLAERTAEGKQWSKLGEGGWWTCIQLLLKGLMTPKQEAPSYKRTK